MSKDELLPEPGFSAKARRTGEQPISFLMAVVVAHPQLINLAAGLVDPLTLPVEAVRQITAKILSDPARGRAALQYDTTQGVAELRRAALKHLEELENKPAGEMGLSERDLIITTGSQQALYLIGDVLVDPGDIVIAANPCYFVYTGTLASFGATVLTAPMRDDGIDVDEVENLLSRLEREGRLEKVKLIYVTSYYQNPTGLTLSLDGRRRLLEIAKKFSVKRRILILEDAAYRELRYDGPALPSIKSLDPRNEFTILTQTFSKPFAPGLKTGYSAMPRELLEALIHQKGNHDFGSSSLNQHIALEALESGLYAEQVRRLCESYRAKRDAMLESLERHMPRLAGPAFSPSPCTRGEGGGEGSSGSARNAPHPILRKLPEDRERGKEGGIRWTRPNGGLYVWVTLPESIDTSRDGALFKSCIDRGVIYVPGDYCFQPDESGQVPKNFMRLSFGQVAPDKIEPGIARLCEAIASQLATGNKQLATIP